MYEDTFNSNTHKRILLHGMSILHERKIIIITDKRLE